MSPKVYQFCDICDTLGKLKIFDHAKVMQVTIMILSMDYS